MSLQLPPAELTLPKLREVDQSKIDALTEFLRLCEAIYHDPAALRLERGKSSTGAMVVIGHNKPTLKIDRWLVPSDDPTGIEDKYTKMSVREHPDEMFFVVEHRVITEVGFRTDPFINLIMDYFRDRYY